MERARSQARVSDEGFRSFSMNITLAKKILEALRAQGVKDIILCAGARNSPLVVLLERSQGFQIFNCFEERSAGFFALGRSQRDQTPVAVMTTSGTAVAELLPSAVEATYTQTPLIFVTADRPRNYRGTGAPQSIDQVGIFFKYVETCVDIAHPEEELDLSLWTRTAPLQINVCFDEPLIDEEIPAVDFEKLPSHPTKAPPLVPIATKAVNQPLVIVGPLSTDEAKELAPHLEKLGAPIYAETLSNLRNEGSLQKLFIRSGEKIIRELFVKGLCQSVVRAGGVPTLRFWRDLEESFRLVPVQSISSSDFTGLSRPVHHLVGLKNMPLVKAQWAKDPRAEIFQMDRNKSEKLEQLLKKYPQSEVSLISQLSKKMKSSFTYVGNSLPIREWDLVCPFEKQLGRQSGNRGANGIDGQISSFMGGSTTAGENWALLGDLTTMYDLSAPWMTGQLEKMKMRLVVINNQGGLIFKNIFKKEIFLNRHQFEFSKWAEMWNWDYKKWDQVPDQMQLGDHVVIELKPNPEQSHLFWQEYQSL